MYKSGLNVLSSLLVVVALLLVAACGGAAEAPAAGDAATDGDAAAEGGTIAIEGAWARAMLISNPDGGDMEGMDHGGDMEGMDHGGAMEGMEGMDHGGDMAHGGGANSAAYMRLVNSGDADTLIAATTDVAEVVELHTVEMTEEGVMQMRPVPGIDVPASGEVELQPGGFHVMMIGLNDDLKEGEMVDITLTFENAGEQTISVPVRMTPPE